MSASPNRIVSKANKSDRIVRKVEVLHRGREANALSAEAKPTTSIMPSSSYAPTTRARVAKTARLNMRMAITLSGGTRKSAH